MEVPSRNLADNETPRDSAQSSESESSRMENQQSITSALPLDQSASSPMTKTVALTTNGLDRFKHQGILNFAESDDIHHSRRSFEGNLPDSVGAIESNSSSESGLIDVSRHGIEGGMYPRDGKGDCGNSNDSIVQSLGSTHTVSVYSAGSDNPRKQRRRVESEALLRKSLAKLADYKQRNERSSRIREHFSTANTRGGCANTPINRELSAGNPSQLWRTKLKSWYSDEDAEGDTGTMPSAPEFVRSQTCSGDLPCLPPSGLFRSKTSTSILSNWGTDKSNTTESEGDSSSLPGDLVMVSRRRQFIQRDQLTDSFAWFSSHAPRCVLQDLFSNELTRLQLDSESNVLGEHFHVRKSSVLKEGSHFFRKSEALVGKFQRNQPRSKLNTLTKPDLLNNDNNGAIIETTPINSSLIKQNWTNHLNEGNELMAGHPPKSGKDSLEKSCLIEDDLGYEGESKILRKTNTASVTPSLLRVESECECERLPISPTLSSLNDRTETKPDTSFECKPRLHTLSRSSVKKLNLLEVNNDENETKLLRPNLLGPNLVDGERRALRWSQTKATKPSLLESDSEDDVANIPKPQISSQTILKNPILLDNFSDQNEMMFCKPNSLSPSDVNGELKALQWGQTKSAKTSLLDSDSDDDDEYIPKLQISSQETLTKPNLLEKFSDESKRKLRGPNSVGPSKVDGELKTHPWGHTKITKPNLLDNDCDDDDDDDDRPIMLQSTEIKQKKPSLFGGDIENKNRTNLLRPNCRKLDKPNMLDDDDASLSSLSDNENTENVKKELDGVCLSKNAADIVSSSLMPRHALPLPYTVKRDCALLFVDITGFTKLSTMLDVEALSKVINAYFRMIVDEVVKYGGDILKFAGDAFFAEWRVTSDENDDLDAETIHRERMLHYHPMSSFLRSLNPTFGETNPEGENRSLSACVFAASMCASSIVENYSDFNVPHPRDLSISFGKDQQSDAMLNVHCGVGVGTLVGLHVGDCTRTSEGVLTENRREYLVLGSPIDQVSKAADVATDGQVLASPEAICYLTETCRVSDDMLQSMEPVLIASREFKYVQPKSTTRPSVTTLCSKASQQSVYASVVAHCKDLDEITLARLHRQLALYVHPVVRGDDQAVNTLMHGAPAKLRSPDASQNRHRAEAELRTVYTMFVKAVMSPSLTGIDSRDNELYAKLQSIMQVTCRELDKYRGHLRQFIVDDKGVVLIATFGLRGSTFAHMVANHALPATFALHTALKSELKVENRIGATFGKVYCGVVGGIRRHEFAVMGAGVNLAARLMHSPKNNGILVDEAVQAHADARFAFKSLPPVQAKGYDHPVIIFEPLHAVHNKRRGNSHGHIGRRRDIGELMDVARGIMSETLPSQTIMAFVIGESGMGKTALGHCVSDEVKKYAREHGKQVIVARSISTETEQRIPLSSFKKIFLCAIKELCLHDGTISAHEIPGGVHPLGLVFRTLMPTASRRGSSLLPRRRMSTGRSTPRRISLHTNHVDSSSSVTSMKSQVQGNVPYLQKLCDICKELNYPYEYADIVGSQLLGLDGAIPHTHIEGHVPTIEEVVDFLTTTYIRLTDFSDLIIIFLDDFQWIDSLTWKVIRVLCQKGKNILLMGTMRSQETQALRRMSSVGAWHGEMQSRILEFPLGPLDLAEVKEAISKVLGYEESVIDDSLCLDIYQRTGGLPIYAIELLESIKRKKAVAIDEESGLLRWTPGAQSGQDRMGSNNVAMIELSFLERFDALDATVRRVLQTCAVLGISISLSDVIRVHLELEETVIEQSLNGAVDELILIEDAEDEDEDDVSLWSDDESRANQSKAKRVALNDRFFQFSHAMWRKSVLDAMLKEQKIHLHRLIAEAMETEQVHIMESSDIGRLLTLFDHWKYCGNFSKAAPLALAVGLRLEEWDLAAQSLDVYRDALEMCYESADRADDEGETPRSGNELWLHASAPTTTLEFILRLHIRIAKCHARLGDQEQCATTFEDAYKIISTSTEATRFNSELLLPVISGLCAIAIQRGTFDEESVAEQGELVNMFVDEAERHEDAYHLCRALAMEAYFHARHGQFDCALLSVERLFREYDIELHSAAIREDYGKDYAAQTFANSTEWLWMMGEEQMASDRADFVVTSLLPHFDPGEVDAKMELTFPILMVLNALGRSAEAEATLFNKIINPYHDFGGSNSYWLKFFNPFAYLMEVIKMETDGVSDAEVMSDIENWVIDDENSIFAPELQRKGNRIVGEICWRLSRLKVANGDNADNLLERGRMLLARVAYLCDGDQSDAFLIMQAREIYGKFDDDSDFEPSENHQNRRTTVDVPRLASSNPLTGTTASAMTSPSSERKGSHVVPSSFSQSNPTNTGCCCTVM